MRAAKTARLKGPRRSEGDFSAEATMPPVMKRQVPKGVKTADRLIAVGASTGGTEAIREFLVGMPVDCPGIVIVQHMPENFTKMFAERLNGLCQINVKEAEHNDPILPGHAYIAPGGKHLWVKRDDGQLLCKLSTEAPMNLHRPSVDFLFRSCAKFIGADAVGVIMTGMGRDGADGMKAMKEKGAWNIAQDEATSVIFGMPREAIEVDAVHEVAPGQAAMALTAVEEEGSREMNAGRGAQARVPHLPPRGRDLRGRHPPGPGDPRGERGHARASRGAVRAWSHQPARGHRADRGPGPHVRLSGAGAARGRQRHRARRRSPLLGLVVSSVSDVLALAEDEISPTPELGTRAIAAAIAGIGTRRGANSASSVLLLDVDYVLRRVREDQK